MRHKSIKWSIQWDQRASNEVIVLDAHEMRNKVRLKSIQSSIRWDRRAYNEVKYETEVHQTK